MAKTPAERQAALRDRRKRQAIGADSGEHAGQVNVFIKASARNALRRLASRWRITQREVLERLLTEAENAVTAAMGDEESERYMGAVLSVTE